MIATGFTGKQRFEVVRGMPANKFELRKTEEFTFCCCFSCLDTRELSTGDGEFEADRFIEIGEALIELPPLATLKAFM